MKSNRFLYSLTKQFEAAERERDVLSGSLKALEHTMNDLSGRIEREMISRGLTVLGEPITEEQRGHLIKEGYEVGSPEDYEE